MQNCPKRRAGGLLFCVSACLLALPHYSFAADAAPASYGALSQTLLQRAQNEVVRIQALVEQGTLPKSRLDQAQQQLDDARDREILAETLYGTVRVQDMTADQAQAMLGAAQRRVDRQSKLLADRQKLLDNGVIARSDLAAFQDELDSRKRVLQLAQNRIALLDDLRQMADAEQRLESAARLNAPALKDVMIRYDGSGVFALSELPSIASGFERQFHRPLPVSAIGETLLHQSMGLDHRNRVDVALNPDQPEGIWLRQFLEHQHIPYLAFRSAVPGAATAPHIHIGPGSTRLKLAQR